MEDLEKSTLIRAGQRPALIAGVPINVFLVEAVAGLALLAAFKFWVAIFFPIHLWLVVKTAEDFHWVRTMWTNWKFYIGVPNKGLKGKKAITFSPAPVKAEKDDYADLY